MWPQFIRPSNKPEPQLIHDLGIGPKFTNTDMKDHHMKIDRLIWLFFFFFLFIIIKARFVRKKIFEKSTEEVENLVVLNLLGCLATYFKYNSCNIGLCTY